MKNLTKDLIEHIYDYSIGDKYFWKSNFSNVINDITYFNAYNIVEDYFNHNYFRYKNIDIDIINCLFYAPCLAGVGMTINLSNISLTIFYTFSNLIITSSILIFI